MLIPVSRGSKRKAAGAAKPNFLNLCMECYEKWNILGIIVLMQEGVISGEIIVNTIYVVRIIKSV
jgi:hypothetical protein